MPVLLILASVAILAGVVVVAVGRGGEMAEFAADYPPFEPDDLLTPTDVTMLRPPSALWGYNAAVTNEALGRIAQVVMERDIEIATLRKQLAQLRVAAEPSGTSASDSAASVESDLAASADSEPAASADSDLAASADSEPAASVESDLAASGGAAPAPAVPAPTVPSPAPAEAVPAEAVPPDAASGDSGTGPDV